MNQAVRNWTSVAGFIFTSGLLLALTGGTVSEASASAPPNHKVTICHATDSNHNPYVVVTADIASAGYLQGGHDGHTGPIRVSGDQAAHINWGDIIPPYTYVRADGTTFTYAGMNWTAEGQATLANGCITPGQPTATPSTRPTSGSTPTPGTTPTPGSTPAPESSPTALPTQTGGVAAATATPSGGVLADTGTAPTGQGFGLTLVLIGLLAMGGAAIAWRRRTA